MQGVELLCEEVIDTPLSGSLCLGEGRVRICWPGRGRQRRLELEEAGGSELVGGGWGAQRRLELEEAGGSELLLLF